MFTRARVAVFVDGCFWHGCPQHHTVAKSNADFWAAKAAGNRARDERVNATLSAARWTVLRFWEHEDPAEVAERIAEAVRDLADTHPPSILDGGQRPERHTAE